MRFDLLEERGLSLAAILPPSYSYHDTALVPGEEGATLTFVNRHHFVLQVLSLLETTWIRLGLVQLDKLLSVVGWMSCRCSEI